MNSENTSEGVRACVRARARVKRRAERGERRDIPSSMGQTDRREAKRPRALALGPCRKGASMASCEPLGFVEGNQGYQQLLRAQPVQVVLVGPWRRLVAKQPAAPLVGARCVCGGERPCL